MRTANRIGWIVAMFCAIVLVATFITTSSKDFASGAQELQKRRGDVVACDSKKWERFVGVGSSPVLARFDITMKACWKTAAADSNPGMVLDDRSEITVQIYNNGSGDTFGATWTKMEKWRPGWYPLDHRWRVTQMQHIGFRQCVVIGQWVCHATADFNVGGMFTSPYLIKRSDGSVDRWDFVWSVGEPNKEPGSFDDNVYICNDVKCE